MESKIIKTALGACENFICKKCPYSEIGCRQEFFKDVLNYIEKLEKENVKLQVRFETMESQCSALIKEIQTREDKK